MPIFIIAIIGVALVVGTFLLLLKPPEKKPPPPGTHAVKQDFYGRSNTCG